MKSNVTKQHQWLHQFVGEWSVVHICSTGPGSEPSRVEGTLSGRNIGELWLVMDCTGTSPDGLWTSQFTLGYDQDKDRFVGTFVASMMHHLWIYSGQLNEDRNRLELDVEGPRMDGKGMATYRDVICAVEGDRWMLRSHILNDEGSWEEFMVAEHTRRSG